MGGKISPERKAAYDAHRWAVKKGRKNLEDVEKERYDNLSPSPELCQIFNIPYGPLKVLKAKVKS